MVCPAFGLIATAIHFSPPVADPVGRKAWTKRTSDLRSSLQASGWPNPCLFGSTLGGDLSRVGLGGLKSWGKIPAASREEDRSYREFTGGENGCQEGNPWSFAGFETASGICGWAGLESSGQPGWGSSFIGWLENSRLQSSGRLKAHGINRKSRPNNSGE